MLTPEQQQYWRCLINSCNQFAIGDYRVDMNSPIDGIIDPAMFRSTILAIEEERKQHDMLYNRRYSTPPIDMPTQRVEGFLVDSFLRRSR